MTEQMAKDRLFEQGFNCAQTVFSHFAGSLDLDEQTALRIASGFGGGMRRGNVCGCVTGALMALGLKSGFDQPGDHEAKKRSSQAAVDFEQLFERRCGSILCRDLLGVDISAAEGKAQAGSVVREKCPGFVTTACEILEQTLGD